MANQYTKLTRANILTKVNRKKNPIQSAAHLASEFGYNTGYQRSTGEYDTAVPAHFRARVQALVGRKVWNQIRQGQFVNLAYR